MQKNEFIRRAVGLPWVDRACSFEAMDCWGVVVMYFRYVYGEELPCVNGYISKKVSIVDGISEQLSGGVWERVDKPGGDCIVFVSYTGGMASHVGVVVDGRLVLHSAGNTARRGQVRCDRLESFIRLSPHIEFYQYRGCRCL